MNIRVSGFGFRVSGLIMALALLAGTAWADLTITITPGYTFSTSERPTTTTLNLLGRPSAEVTGTLGGTNVSLGAATVSGTMLMDSVAGSNLTWNGSSPRGLVIGIAGVYPTNLNSAVAGDGLAGGSPSALSVNVGGSNLAIVSDTIRIVALSGKLIGGGTDGYGTNIAMGWGVQITNNALSLSNTTFVSYDYVVSSGVVFNTNHSLGGIPILARFALVCQTNDVGFVPGDSLELENFSNSGGLQNFAAGVNATNAFVVYDGNNVFVHRKDTGVLDGITLTRWLARCVARP